ncbi:hypothetical protein, partial [Zavarzinia sp.]|uniref:hypothetical protein n=1 Tax=Zavarzinia sp. TaxID=2027920 RepID=UPI003BB7A80A
PPQPAPEPKKPVIRIAAAPPEASNKAPVLLPAPVERSLIDEALAAGRITRCPPAYAGTVEGGARLDLGGHQPIEKSTFRHPQRK